MHFFRGLYNVPADFDGCVATIGNFDGLHLGHREILAGLRAASKAKCCPTLVMLFEPHPKECFAPDAAPSRLANLREKLLDLREAGVDYVLCIPFNRAFSSLTAEAFIKNVLVNSLKIRHLIVGDDFRFGVKRSGDYQTLHAAGKTYGFEVEDSSTYLQGGERVSSSRVREALESGQLHTAESLLGRPYRMQGRVAHGMKLGRTLNTPTANVLLKRLRAPLRGVYAVRARLEEAGVEWQAVANVGFKPTVSGEAAPTLEVHLFDFDGDIYGNHLNLEFLSKIRDEQKFADIEALRQAIEHDKASARAFFDASK